MDEKFLKGILLALLDGKLRDDKAKILKEAGFKQPDIIELIGISETTKRTRKLRAKKKNGKEA